MKNSITIEIYETLHKDYVKIPYWMTNKIDFMKQIVKLVSAIIMTALKDISLTNDSN